jgi:hypothetical protein
MGLADAENNLEHYISELKREWRKPGDARRRSGRGRRHAQIRDEQRITPVATPSRRPQARWIP